MHHVCMLISLTTCMCMCMRACMQIQESQAKLDEALGVFDLPASSARLASLENDANAPGIWDDATKAQELLSRLSTARCGAGEGGGGARGYNHLQFSIF
jgi:hypothetical protein